MARGFIAIEAVGRTTPAIATSSGERGEGGGGFGGDVVSCDRRLQPLLARIPDGASEKEAEL